MTKAYHMLIILVLIQPIAAGATSNDWQFYFGNGAYVGTSAGAHDDFDAMDVAKTTTLPFNTAVYHQSGADGWSGPTGLYIQDMRATLPAVAGTSRTWRFYLWGDTSLPPEITSTNFIWTASPAPYDKVHFRLTYVRSAIGLTDPWNTVGMSVLLNGYVDGYGIHVPAYRTSDPLTGYIFEMTATVVPEPGALLCLLAGLTGLVVRRRR